MCQDEYLIKSAWEFKNGVIFNLIYLQMEDSWSEFKNIFKQHPTLFPKGEYSRDLFFWAY